MASRALRAAWVAGLSFAAIAAATADASAAACNGMPGPSGAIELEIGGATRPFAVRLPAHYDARTPVPLIFLFHPGGMNIQYMQGLVPSRSWPEAIAVYPQGLPRPTAGFRPGWQVKQGDSDDQDLRFFDAMLAWLDSNHCIDSARVFVMGYSNGAQLASVLACERSARLAGVAIASGAPACEPVAPEPVIIGHGRLDSVIPYERAAEAAVAWSARNACSAPPRGDSSGCVAADGCATAPVVLCTYEGGHEYHAEFTRAAVEFLKAAAAVHRR